MRCTVSLAVLAALTLSTSKRASARPDPRIWVAGSLGGATPSDRPIQARLHQQIRLYAVIEAGKGARTLYYTDAPGLVRGRRIIPGNRVRPLRSFPLFAGGSSARVSFQWYLVEPHTHHKRLKPPNPGQLEYANAVLFGKNHGKWIKLDTLEYFETALAGTKTGSTLMVDRASPTHSRLKINKGLGTMRYKVVVRWGGKSLGSPGMEAVGRAGILPSVFRVSFRLSDDLAGFMTSYFNVPYVFGSTGTQTDEYQGTDCADVIVGAVRRAGVRMPYTSVSGLLGHSRIVSDRLLMKKNGFFATRGKGKGRPVLLRYGKDVQPGDLMLIDYVGFTATRRSWDHVAVLFKDEGVKGVLDPRDRILHMGSLYGLVDAPAIEEGPAFVRFVRLKRKYLAAFGQSGRRAAAKTGN